MSLSTAHCSGLRVSARHSSSQVSALRSSPVSTSAPAVARSSARSTRRHITTTCRASTAERSTVARPATVLRAPQPSSSQQRLSGSSRRVSGVVVSRHGLQGSRRGRSAAVRVEANIFARISRLIKSTVDGIVGNFEDPEQLLDRVVNEMQEDAMKMRQASAQVMASQRQMATKQKAMQDQADQWLRRAELAVASGQEDLAREALKRRKTLQGDAERLQAQVNMQKQASDQLQANVQMLENKISEARGKKETLKARAASARTAQQIQELVGGLRSMSSSSFSAFEKMEEKVEAMEAQAQVGNALSAPENLEQRFQLLEGQTGVEDDLEALKRARLSAPKQQQTQMQRGQQRMSDYLQPNSTPEVEKELEELRSRWARM